MNRSGDSAALPILRRLSAKEAHLDLRDKDRPVVVCAGKPNLRCDPNVARSLVARGLLAFRDKHTLALTESGTALVRRHVSGVEEYAAQHQGRAEATIADETLGEIRVLTNDNESPLARLRARKDGDGQPLLSASEYAAGERLRSDYTRAQLMPRVTSNWSAAVASNRREGTGRGVDLTEAAIAARRRVEHALAATGPEFAGVLVDVCCFLKGLEEIERERRWPARSAKVVLRFALTALARHYGLAGIARGKERAATRRWGSDGYRPSLD